MSAPRWLGAWSASAQHPDTGTGTANDGWCNRTVRQVMRLGAGGSAVRVRLSNEYGAAPLRIGSASVALHAGASAVQAASLRGLRFSGRPSVTIPAHGVVYSDAVALEVAAFVDIAVSVHVPEATGPATWHRRALSTVFVSPPGDYTGHVELPVAATSESGFWISAVEVDTPVAHALIVAIGDSLTDGSQSTPDAHQRYPDHLARRLADASPQPPCVVLNQGIGGNRLLRSTTGASLLERFERDVCQAGATHALVLIGCNDIALWRVLGRPEQEASAHQIVAGLQQLARQALQAGIILVAGTIPPFGGSLFALGDNEKKRQQVNRWIRCASAFAGVSDFDAALRDLDDPLRLLPAYASEDCIHPNDAGYRAMAEAVDLSLLLGAARRLAVIRH